MSRWIANLLVALAPRRALAHLQRKARRAAGLVRRELTLPCGQRCVYLDGGEGEVILLVHGFGGNKDNFCRLAALLTERYRVIVPDLPGFGESDRPAGADYSCTAQAGRLLELLDALGVARCHLAGNSMGGQISLSLAVLAPQRLLSVAVFNSSGLWSVTPARAWLEADRRGANPLLVRSVEDYQALLADSFHRVPEVPAALLRVLAKERSEQLALEQQIFHAVTEDSIEERIRGLALPTLVLWGEEDRIISPDAGRRLGELLADARLVLLPQTGHLPMLEAPQQVAEHYLCFLAELAERRRQVA